MKILPEDIPQDDSSYLLTDGSRIADTLRVGSSPSDLDTFDVDGTIRLDHTATENDDHALEIDCDAAGFGDVKGIDIVYATGAIATGEDEECIFIQIDESSAAGGDVIGLDILSTEGSADKVIGLFAGVLIDPIEQLSGTFADADTVLDEAADVTTDLSTGGGGNIAVFTNDDETMTIGDAAKFEEVEFLLDTFSSGAGIQPKWEFSTGVGTWSEFSPADGTNGMRNNGVAAWLDSDIASWAVGTGSEYLIRVTRQRNSLTTTPIMDKVQISAATEYYWDKDGDIKCRQLESDIATGTAPLVVASTTVVSNLNADQLDGNEAAAFLLLSGGTMSGDIDCDQNDLLDVGVIAAGSDFTPDSNAVIHIQHTSASVSPTTTTADVFQVESNGDTTIQVISSGTSSGQIGFTDGTRNMGRVQYNHTTNELAFYGNSTKHLHTNSSGHFFVDVGRVQAGGADARFQSGGELTSASSSRRYKTRITDLDFAWSVIYTLPKPQSFNYTSEKGSDRPFETKGRNFGYIAEDVEQVFPELVGYLDTNFDPDKEPGEWTPNWISDSVSYAMLTPLHNEALKDHSTQLADLTARIEALERGGR